MSESAFPDRRQAWAIGISWGLFGTLLGLNLGLQHRMPSLVLFSQGWWQVAAPVYAVLLGIMGWGVAVSLRRRNEAVHRFYLGLSVASLVYFGGVILGGHPSQATAGLALRLLTALPPLLALGWIFRESLRYLGSLDEPRRRIEHRALLVATGVVAVTSLGAGFLQTWSVSPRVGLLLLWAELYLVWVGARAWLGRRSSG